MASSPSPVSPWTYAAWIFGTILVIAIFLALGATIWRMEQTYNIVDSDIASADDFQKMIQSSLRWTQIGLFVGIPAALLYIVSLVMCHRSKDQDEWD